MERESLRFAQEALEILTALDRESGALVSPREQPSLITIDMILPQECGYEVVRCVTENQKQETIPSRETDLGSDPSPVRPPFLALALASALSLSCSLGPVSPTGGQEVQLDHQRAAAYWTQFEQRLPRWFNEIKLSVPQVPPRDVVLTEARFIEIALGETHTCWFDPPNRLEIRTDLWESGCVPHEIGHLALKLAGHPCWGEWEHRDEVRKCQERFQ